LEVIVFDLGGTLMEYKGMPYSWVDYYEKAFIAVSNEFGLELSAEDIQKSCDVMESKNARVIYREVEYTPEEVFAAVTDHWKEKANIDDIIHCFYKGHDLKPIIFHDTIECLERLIEKGKKIAALTDLPTAMPDALFQKDIAGLLEYFDLYVSSQTCGYRKPNKNGLLYIAKHFNIGAEGLVFIGDEEKDIKAAKNVGCASVLITRGASQNGERDYGQDLAISSLDELIEVLHI